ncbi:monovalent cation/H+ antiporter complex subunit F [Aquibaculum arenosum]|uniref:Monovalent cation/H+ antiporter complex subunit F n=1 Tax=Aquibaculum arenosum TaxID=3032591 RepID=A0ABT5YHW6_9PROT|nr:monovalent cation/H+ antiporter complex subunit F [Fodinicurvata sp. CAU 1616]MDF2094536.1 monovalent cation/H+ antiporter complex subunit F [Fodinicurvata sp. CAU 1616]
MTDFYLAVAAFLLLTILLGLWRVLRGPAPADRMMAAQLFGTTGLATVLLLGAASDQGAAVDIALTFALLAALSSVAFVRCARRIPPAERKRRP